MPKNVNTTSASPGTGTRALAYLRVSTAGQAERGMGLETQRDRVRAFAEAKGLNLLAVVAESASGGVRDGEDFSYEHRPVLLSLIERAERGEYDALVVARFDRLSRDYATLIVLERRLQRHGVRLLSAAEENGDGAIAEFMRGQLALVAQLERAMILDRVGAGKAKKKALGRHVHGRVAFGYRSTGGLLSPHDDEAEVVRRIFAEARDGRTPGRIARDLNRDGIPSPTGATWGKNTLRWILTNPGYAGEKYGVQKAHGAIVSRRAWNAAQLALASRARG